MIINNTAQALTNLTVRTTVYNLDASLQYAQTNSLVTAAPSAATDLGLIPFPTNGLSAVHFVKLQLRDSQLNLLSDNFYWRETVQDNFKALDGLPLVTLNVQATNQIVGSNFVLTVTLTNPSPNIALMSHLQLRQASSGRRVLPVFYSENYISLLPGENRTLTVTAATADLAGDAPQLVVDGWNVTVNPSAASGNYIAITNNPPAAAHSGSFTTPASVYRINCGGTSVGTNFFQFGPPYTNSGFSFDNFYDAGSTAATGHAVNTNTANAAPQIVYKSERWGAMAYTFPMASGLANYIVRLHFCEAKFASAGQRIFNVAINGQTVLTNFDIYAAAGATFTAVVRDFNNVWPDSSTNIVISFIKGSKDNPKICGIEVFPNPTNSIAPPSTNVIINVVMQPSQPGRFAITWPTALGTNWNLYVTTNLAPPVVWFPVTNTILTVNGTNQVNIGSDGSSQFFRLEAQ
jgi:hypothetical protein